MGVIVPTGDMQMTWIFTNSLTSKEFTFSIGFLDNGSLDTDPAVLAEALYDEFVTASTGFCAAGNMATGWHFEGISGFYQSLGGPVLGSHLVQVNGSGSDNDIPVNCAFLCKKNTAAGGRAGRGRLYAPPIMPALTTDTDGKIDGTQASISGDQINDNALSVGGSGWLACVHHSDGSPGNAITSIVGQSQLATQRRRMR